MMNFVYPRLRIEINHGKLRGYLFGNFVTLDTAIIT